MSVNDCIASLFVLSCFGGCALVYENKYDWDEGWREGTVVHLGTGVALPPISPGDCRENVPDDVVARTRYADVLFKTEARLMRHRIVPIPHGLVIEEGQRVYVNAHSCGDTIVKASSA